MRRIADYLRDLNNPEKKSGRDTEEVLLIVFSGISLVLLLLIIFAGRMACSM